MDRRRRSDKYILRRRCWAAKKAAALQHLWEKVLPLNSVPELRPGLRSEPARLHPLQERLYSFEFPESPGALLRFLNTLGTHWNISLFHYRSHGTDYGRVLAAFELGDHEPDFETRLNELGYDCHDETNNPAFRFFLAG